MNRISPDLTSRGAVLALAGLLVATPLSAQRVIAISGSGFKPASLTVGSTVSTPVTADEDTILVIEQTWGKCVAWTVIRGRTHTFRQFAPDTCEGEDEGDAILAAMSGESMVRRVLWMDMGKADKCAEETAMRAGLAQLRAASESPNSVIPGVYYRLINRATGKCIEVGGKDPKDGANINQWGETDWGGGTHQEWRLEPTSGEYYRIFNRATGKCIEVGGKDPEDGANIDQWQKTDWGGGTHQEWRLEPTS